LPSVAVFAVVMAVLVSLDDRVRERFGELLSAGTTVAPLSHRAMDLGNALVGAIADQSIENAPLLVFACVGGMLFLFMVRT